MIACCNIYRSLERTSALGIRMLLLALLSTALISRAEDTQFARRINLAAGYIVFDAVRNRILASAPVENAIRSVNPMTGEHDIFLQLPFAPGLMALSNDGRVLWITESEVQQHVFRVHVETASLDPDFTLDLRRGHRSNGRSL